MKKVLLDDHGRVSQVFEEPGVKLGRPGTEKRIDADGREIEVAITHFYTPTLKESLPPQIFDNLVDIDDHLAVVGQKIR